MHEPTVNEELLTQHLADSRPVFRAYEPRDICAVLGAAGEPNKDLLLDSLRADGVSWRFRRGGGGTVVLSPGQVVLALVTRVDSPFRNREYAGEINRWIIDALSGLGVRWVEPRGISDLAIGERKILGTSIYRTRLVLFYQASLLVSNDIALFTRYLAAPSRVPDYRGARNHEEFCTTLRREGYALEACDVAAALGRVTAERLPLLR